MKYSGTECDSEKNHQQLKNTLLYHLYLAYNTETLRGQLNRNYLIKMNVIL